MNTDSVIPMDEQAAKPIVDWYPSGPLRAVSPYVTAPVAAALGALALGVIIYAGFALAKRLDER